MIDLIPGVRRSVDRPNMGIEACPSLGHVEKQIAVSGFFTCWTTRPKSGSIIRKPWRIKNGATTVGCNYLLNTSFRSVTQITTWYAGIISASGFSAVSSSDTISSHAGWTEALNYAESVRQPWSPGAASGGVIVNGTAMAFTINSTANGQGVFIVSDSAKSGTAGTLWCTAVEAAPFSLTSGVVFNVVYQLTLTPVS